MVYSKRTYYNNNLYNKEQELTLVYIAEYLL